MNVLYKIFFVSVFLVLTLDAEGLLHSIINKFKSNSGDIESVLVLNWHNTFCETHSNKKECKRDGGEAKNHLVLHGLWPQPRNKTYCGVSSKIKRLNRAKRWYALPSLDLNSSVKELMTIYMPGSQSNLQRHEYYKHGTCYSKDANSYFYDALTMAKQADKSIGEYLRANIGKRVKEINIKMLTAKSFGKDVKYKVAIKCKRGILRKIWFSLKGRGDDISKLAKNAKQIHSNCKTAIVDAPGKFRR